jgi:Glycosyl hydrolase family 76
MTPPPRASSAAARALEAWGTLNATFLRPGARDALEVWEGPQGPLAPLWPASQVLAASIDVGTLTGDLAPAEALVRGLAVFLRGDAYVPRPGDRRHYFDDNAWVGLELLRLHALTGEPAHLAAAARVFAFIETGQDRDGGVRWVQRRSSRNACATAPAAELALRLYLVDPREGLVRFARRAMEWLERTLRLGSGLIADREDRGVVEPTVWSYNQGAALGAFALLHRVEGREADLEAARTLARVSLSHFTGAHFTGDVVWAHPPVFNAIWFRNLLDLDARSSVPGLAAALDGYLDRVWREARDPVTGLFTRGGIGSYDGTPAIDHGGLTQLFALRAARESRPKTSGAQLT